MKKSVYFILLPVVITLFINCASTEISNLDAFQAVNVEMAEIMPTKEELAGEKVKIAVYDIEDINDTSKRANIAEKLNEQIKKQLLEANVELVDREAAGKYKDEIILASQESGTFSGPQFASFVVQGKISTVNFSVKLGNTVSTVGTALNTYSLLSDGKLSSPETLVEETCKYSAKIAGEYTIYSLPDLKVINQFIFSDEETKNIPPQRNVSSGGDVIAAIFVGKVPGNCPVNKNLVDQLASQAASEAIRKGRIEIQNLFSPKGYIESVYRQGDQYIAKITIGKKSRVKEGYVIDVYSYDVVTNNLTGKIENNEKKIAEGVVSNQVGESHAWIIFSDAEQAKKIRLGDFVKVRFIKSSSENFGDMFG